VVPVILVDVNLLVYAKMDCMEHHEAAHVWLDERLSGRYGVGLPWSSLLSFVRLVTNRRIFHEPMSFDAAWRQVDEWLALPPVFTPEPARAYQDILRSLMREISRPDLVPDAQLAALAIEFGLTLHSTDRDFARFTGLKWENPLVA
jgi:uncharacterized protein